MPLAAAIAGGLGLIGGLIGANSAKKAQNRANQANIELAKMQNDWAIAQWERENEYNTPENQMQRLKDAGINPNMAYANGNLSNISAQSPTIQRAQVNPYLGDAQNMQSTIQNMLQLMQLKSVIENTKADTKKKVADAQVADTQSSVNEANANFLTIEALKSEASRHGIEINNRLLDAYGEENMRLQMREIESRILLNKRSAAEKDSQILKNHSDIGLNDAKITQLGWTIKHIRKQMEVADSEIYRNLQQGKLLSHQATTEQLKQAEIKITNSLRELGINPNDSSVVQILSKAVFDPVYADALIENLDSPAGLFITNHYLGKRVNEGSQSFKNITSGVKDIFELIPGI